MSIINKNSNYASINNHVFTYSERNNIIYTNVNFVSFNNTIMDSSVIPITTDNISVSRIMQMNKQIYPIFHNNNYT